MICTNDKPLPPQTYSRLFRPWDGGKQSSDQTKSVNNSILVSESKVTDQMFSKSGTISVVSERLLQASVRRTPSSPTSASISSIPVPPTISAIPSGSVTNVQMNDRIYSPGKEYPEVDPTAAAAVSFYATYSDMLSTAPSPYLPIDPFAASAMEQEYVRVMTEEAQAKILSARKQRPKKFKCPHCNVAFSNNGQLKGHVRIHTGERPFKCDEPNCGKTFTRNEELTRHKRIHTGLRPYACTTCGKRFGRRDHLKKHTKTHFVQERYLAPTMFLPLYPYLYGY